MKVIIPGHRYEVENFEDSRQSQIIQFIHKEPNPENNDQLQLASDGTTNEELLKVLIDRMQFLNTAFPCRENAVAITNLEQALMWLEKRTRDRIARSVEGKNLN
jgi:hypothetical protein